LGEPQLDAAIGQVLEAVADEDGAQVAHALALAFQAGGALNQRDEAGCLVLMVAAIVAHLRALRRYPLPGTTCVKTSKLCNPGGAVARVGQAVDCAGGSGTPVTTTGSRRGCGR